jgi:hypothetical protein
VVLDGVTESKITEKLLRDYLESESLYRAAAPILLSGRPNDAIRKTIKNCPRAMIVEPLSLDDTTTDGAPSTLDRFLSAYGGAALEEPVKRACAESAGAYLPIRVRMALSLGDARSNIVDFTDIYREFFHYLAEAKYDKPAARGQLIDAAAAWCLRTYWVGGEEGRHRSLQDVDSSGDRQLVDQLENIGILELVDKHNRSMIRFFHDSMQTYLTARALGSAERDEYRDLPRPSNDVSSRSWDRSRVFLWAAGSSHYRAGGHGDSELFEMCLKTHQSAEQLIDILYGYIIKWKEFETGFRDTELASRIRRALDRFDWKRGLSNSEHLTQAAERARSMGLKKVAALYAAIAPLVLKIETSPGPEDQDGPGEPQ